MVLELKALIFTALMNKGQPESLCSFIIFAIEKYNAWGLPERMGQKHDPLDPLAQHHSQANIDLSAHG